MKSGIYCIYNIVNSKRYIGQAENIEKRWKSHLSRLRTSKHENEHLQRSWEKYGEKSFNFLILEETEKDFFILNEREIYWIGFYNTLVDDFGYNERSGGNSGRHSERTKKKMSDSLSGENHPLWGKTHSPDTIEKMKKQKKKENHPLWHKERTQETKNKIRESMLGDKSSSYDRKLDGASSKYHGVTKYKSGYVVSIKINGKSKYLGFFKNEIDAAKKYNEEIIINNLNKKLNDVL